jgi:hypothetical protein
LKYSDYQPKKRSRKSDEVSNRTRSKTDSIERNVGDRTRFQVHFIHNSGPQGNFFPLNDATNFDDKRKKQGVNLQSVSADCRSYQSVILNPKLHYQLDHLRQMHILNKLEDVPDKSWDCIKVVRYPEEKTTDYSVEHTCLVEWNALNR